MKKLILLFIAITIFTCNIMDTVYAKDIEVVDSIDDVEKAGLYYIKIVIELADGVQQTKLVKMNVKFEKTIISDKNKEGIDAHDVQVGIDILETLSNKELIKAANAHAWNTDTGDEIAVSKVEIIPTSKKDEYELSFSTEKGTTTKVNAYEVEHVMERLQNIYRNQKQEFEVKNYTLLVLNISLIFFIPVIIILFVYWSINNKLRKTRDLLYEKKLENMNRNKSNPDI